MPLVHITAHEGQFDDSQKARLIARVTDAVAEVEGLGAGSRASTWVQIDEAPAGSFGVGGRVLRYSDFLDLLSARGEAAR